MAKKNGPITKEESDFIRENMNGMAVEQIAKSLNRRPATITEYIANNYGASNITTNQPVLAMLRKKPYYEGLKKQFLPEEIKNFEYNYVQMSEQFQNDVFHTEEGQIIDYCRISILLDRTLEKSNENRLLIIEANEQLAAIKEEGPFAEQDMVQMLSMRIASLNAASGNLNKESGDLLARKDAILKSLKGTRDMLRKNIEDSRQNFSSWIQDLATDSEFRKNVGIEMEMHRIAAQRETKRLGTEIEYADGAFDRPLLNSETIKYDD